MLERVGLLRSHLFTIPLIYLYTVALGLVSLLVSPFDRGGRRQHACARWWSRLILATSLVRVRVRGRENLEPGKHYVYVANHQSYLDIPILFAHLPVEFRVMAKASLFSLPFLGWHLRRTGSLPIARKSISGNARRLLQAVGYIQQGSSLLVFPEGGRGVSGGIGEFKSGIFLAAIKIGVPIVPVTIRGSALLLSPESWHIRPGGVEVILDPPVATAGLDKSRLHELVAAVRHRIEENFLGASP